MDVDDRAGTLDTLCQAAGILLIAAAVLGFAWTFSIYAGSGPGGGAGTVAGLAMGVVVLVSGLVLLGGLAALTRSSWTWSATGSVAALLLMVPPLAAGDQVRPGVVGGPIALILGVAAMVLVFVGRSRFPDGPRR